MPHNGAARIGRVLVVLLALGLLVLPAGPARHLIEAHDWTRPGLALLLALPGGVLTLLAAYLIEGALAGARSSSLRALAGASPSVRLDALCMLLSLIPHRYLGYLLSFGLLLAVDRLLDLSRQAPVLPGMALEVGALLLLQSLLSYWVHRLEHAVPALWALHQFHHSADRMSMLTAVRQTELANAVERMALATFFVLIGNPTAAPLEARGALTVSALVFFAYRTFVRVNQYLCHSSLRTDYGWVGRWLLVSPRMHRLHHLVAPEYHDRNFTFDLVIWDRLFGTYASCDGRTLDALALGLEHNRFNTGASLACMLRDYLLTPYRLAWEALEGGARAWVPRRPSPRDTAMPVPTGSSRAGPSDG